MNYIMFRNPTAVLHTLCVSTILSWRGADLGFSSQCLTRHALVLHFHCFANWEVSFFAEYSIVLVLVTYHICSTSSILKQQLIHKLAEREWLLRQQRQSVCWTSCSQLEAQITWCWRKDISWHPINTNTFHNTKTRRDTSRACIYILARNDLFQRSHIEIIAP